MGHTVCSSKVRARGPFSAVNALHRVGRNFGRPNMFLESYMEEFYLNQDRRKHNWTARIALQGVVHLLNYTIPAAQRSRVLQCNLVKTTQNHNSRFARWVWSWTHRLHLVHCTRNQHMLCIQITNSLVCA